MADSIFLKKRRGRVMWLLLPIILFLYLVLFPRPVGREIFLRTIWARSVSPASTVFSDSNAPLWAFRASDTFGYADLDGNLYYIGHRLHNLSLSDSGFINYGIIRFMFYQLFDISINVSSSHRYYRDLYSQSSFIN